MRAQQVTPEYSEHNHEGAKATCKEGSAVEIREVPLEKAVEARLLARLLGLLARSQVTDG